MDYDVRNYTAEELLAVLAAETQFAGSVMSRESMRRLTGTLTHENRFKNPTKAMFYENVRETLETYYDAYDAAQRAAAAAGDDDATLVSVSSLDSQESLEAMLAADGSRLLYPMHSNSMRPAPRPLPSASSVASGDTGSGEEDEGKSGSDEGDEEEESGSDEGDDKEESGSDESDDGDEEESGGSSTEDAGEGGAETDATVEVDSEAWRRLVAPVQTHLPPRSMRGADDGEGREGGGREGFAVVSRPESERAVGEVNALFGEGYHPQMLSVGVNPGPDPTVSTAAPLTTKPAKSLARRITLDSQFRPYANGTYAESTNYVADLTATLKMVTSLSLYSYQIPFAWYTIDAVYGNACFWLWDSALPDRAIGVQVTSGNYTHETFVTELTAALGRSGCVFPPGSVAPVQFSAASGKLSLALDGGTFVDPWAEAGAAADTCVFSPETTRIIFFDFYNDLQCGGQRCGAMGAHYMNNSLGWMMGFRLPIVAVDAAGNEAEAVIDLNGTKYLYLVVDDFQQHRMNDLVVSISRPDTQVKLPDYYAPDQPTTCEDPDAALGSMMPATAMSPLLRELLAEVQSNLEVGELVLAGKASTAYRPLPLVERSAPRTLTNAQIHTVNELQRAQRISSVSFLAPSPTPTNVLGVVPVKTSLGVPTGSLMVEFSGSLQDCQRTYLAPVNLSRLAVKLLDDRGRVLNLNGGNWCATLLAECLVM